MGCINTKSTLDYSDYWDYSDHDYPKSGNKVNYHQGLSFQEIQLRQIDNDIEKCKNLRYEEKKPKSASRNFVLDSMENLSQIELDSPEMPNAIIKVIKEVQRLEMYGSRIEGIRKEIDEIKPVIIKLTMYQSKHCRKCKDWFYIEDCKAYKEIKDIDFRELCEIWQI